MKRRILGLAVALLTFIVGWSIATVILKRASQSVLPSEAPSAWTILLAKQNHDLRQIDGPEKAQLQMAIEALRGVTQNQFLEARLFARVTTNQGEQRYVLIEESPILTIPGGSGLRMSVFNLDGKLLDSSEFGAGWRMSLTEIRVIRVKDIAGDVLEVGSLPVASLAKITRQYYALVRDRMRLIRLEDSDGTLRLNVYSSPYQTIGFTEAGRSAEEWERALMTKDEAEVLATLTWLGGRHLNVDEAVAGDWHEDLSEARLVEELRARPDVRNAVIALKDSPNAWIREAAKAAAEQIH